MLATSASKSRARALPAGVAAVTATASCGYRECSARSSGAAADISPKETACSQMLGAGSVFPKPKRSANPCQ